MTRWKIQTHILAHSYIMLIIVKVNNDGPCNLISNVQPWYIILRRLWIRRASVHLQNA